LVPFQLSFFVVEEFGGILPPVAIAAVAVPVPPGALLD